MNKAILVGIACLSLALVNIAAYIWLGLFGIFITMGTLPIAEKILEIISKMS
jgi:hypothetical protein